MHIRCPHCHNAVEVVGDHDLVEVSCPSCGSDFHLVPATESYTPTTRSIGHFKLLESVGSGAFGTVWKARDTKLDRLVAVKIPRRDQVAPEDAEFFLREARAAAQLRHANIVGVHEVGREDGTLYIVSDFIQGATLADRLASGPLQPREAAELLAQVADALHHAHEAGVIHRDLKPQNIMLEQVGSGVVSSDNHHSQLTPPSSRYSPKLLDFGLAKREAGEVTMTVEGKVLGTAAYMSPEQARGEGHHVDRRTDVYSLGVILFELLTGRRPFQGNVRMLLDQVIHDDPPRPRRLQRGLPHDLETICLKCMEKDRRRRYETAAEAAADLRRFLSGEPIQARPVSRLERTWRYARRRPAAVAALALAMLLVVSSGIGFEMRRQMLSADARAKSLAQSQVETVEHFAQLARRRGEPVGVHPINQEQAETMPRAYRFVTRGGVIQRVEIVNALVPGEDRYSLPELLGAPRVFVNVHREASLVFTRDDNARVTKEEAFDVTDQLLWSLEYGDDGRAVFFDRRAADQSVRLSATRLPLRLSWDAAGWLREMRLVDELDRPRANAAGMHGVRLAHDAGGNLLEVASLDPTGAITGSEVGPAKVALEYDRLGRLVAETYFDQHGKQTQWQGVATAQTQHDDHGYEIAFFGLDGKPSIHGTVDEEFARYSWGTTVQGAHRVRRERAANHVIVETMLGIDGQPVGDHAAERCVFSQRGDLLEWLCLDDKDQPIYSAAHELTRMRRDHDRNGNLVETIHERQDPAGNWVTIRRRNSANNLLEHALFSAAGQPAVDAAGVHRSVYAYDARQNRTAAWFFDAERKPTLRADTGTHHWTRKYDVEGKVVEFRDYDTQGQPMLSPAWKSHGWTEKYDSLDRSVEIVRFGVDDKPAVCAEGWAKLTRSYQENGQLKEKTLWKLSPEGRFVVWKSEDAKGRLLEEAFFGPQDEPVLLANETYHRVRRKFDNTGNLLEAAFFDADDNPSAHKEGGTFRFTNTYDSANRILECNHFDAAGKPMECNFQFARRTYRYPEQGDHTEAIDYIVAESGQWAVRRRWGLRTVLLDEYEFNKQGQRLLSPLGWHHARYQVDDQKRRIGAAFFDVNDNPMLCGGSHRWTTVLDEQGRVVEEAHFGVDGQPIVSIFGFAKRATSYAADGKIDRTVDHVVDRAGNLALNRAKLFGDLGGNVCFTTPSGFVHWSQATQHPDEDIVAISLVGAALTPDQFRAISELPGLQYFTHQVPKNKLSDADLSLLARRDSLVALHLWFSPISDEQLKLLAPLANLQWINLGGTGISMDALPALESFPQLKGLHVEYLKRGASGLEPLTRLKHLEGVFLGSSGINDEDLAHLAVCKNLKQLHLGGTQITDRGLAQLHGVQTLQHLNLAETKVTDEGVRAFQAAVPACRVDRRPDAWMPETLYYPAVRQPPRAVFRGLIAELKGPVLVKTPKGFVPWTPTAGIPVNEVNAVYSADPAVLPRHMLAITALPKLEYLILWSQNGYELSDAAVDQLAAREKLVYLALWHTGLTNDRARKLARLTRLQHLNLAFNKITFEVLADLTDLADLRQLDLAYAQRGPHGLQALARFPKLEVLSFHGSEVSDDDLVDLAGCQRLQRLHLGSTAITDRGLAQLHAAKSLTYLDLSRTNTTAAGIAEFRAAMPDCRIELETNKPFEHALHFPAAVNP